MHSHDLDVYQRTKLDVYFLGLPVERGQDQAFLQQLVTIAVAIAPFATAASILLCIWSCRGTSRWQGLGVGGLGLGGLGCGLGLGGS